MACSFQNTQHYSVIDLKNGGQPEIYWFIKTYIRVIQSDRPKKRLHFITIQETAN